MREYISRFIMTSYNSSRVKVKMSEILKDYRKREIDWKLKISTGAPLSNVRRQVNLSNEILFFVEIPWPLLYLRDRLLKGTSGENENYIDLLNVTVVDQ